MLEEILIRTKRSSHIIKHVIMNAVILKKYRKAIQAEIKTRFQIRDEN